MELVIFFEIFKFFFSGFIEKLDRLALLAMPFFEPGCDGALSV